MLPGRLTTAHIDAAVSRGENYIDYIARIYTISELRAMDETGRQRIEGVPSEPEKGEEPIESTDKDRLGSVGKRSRKAHAEEAPEREEPIESGSEGTSE